MLNRGIIYRKKLCKKRVTWGVNAQKITFKVKDDIITFHTRPQIISFHYLQQEIFLQIQCGTFVW